MPQVHTQIVTGDKGLLVTADGNGIDVVCVGIAKHTPTSCLYDLLHTSDLSAEQAPIQHKQTCGCVKHVLAEQNA